MTKMEPQNFKSSKCCYSIVGILYICNSSPYVRLKRQRGQLTVNHVRNFLNYKFFNVLSATKTHKGDNPLQV